MPHCSRALYPPPGLFFKLPLQMRILPPILQKERRLRGQSEEKLDRTQTARPCTRPRRHTALAQAAPDHGEPTQQRTPEAAGLPTGNRGRDQRLPRHVRASAFNAETLLPPSPHCETFLTEIPESPRTLSDSHTH